jgi:hydrogenase maturation factor HypF (carbamoyltransferase family)
MSNTRGSVGVCPDCGTEIRPGWTLIEYERSDGTMDRFAECGECASVVTPV